MRIGINLYALTLHGGGMRQYVLQLLPWLVRLSAHSFTFYYGSHGASSVALILRQLTREERTRVRAVEIYHQDEIYGLSSDFDLYFCALNSFTPELTDRPTVATLADIQEKFFPEYFNEIQLKFRAVLYPRMARAVTRLITLSTFSKNSICDAFGVPAEKVKAIFLAPNEMMRCAVPAWPADLPALPKTYVFYPANLYPHKNHELLLKTISLLRSRGVDCAAVCTGQPSNPGVDVAARVAAYGLQDRVMWLGHVAPEALRHLYQNALALAYPSQFEGFGMPLVEAMICGCPIITSPVASIPEVVGSAGTLVPQDAAAYADAIQKMLADPTLRQKSIAAGHERAKRFDVRLLAKETLEVFDEAVQAFDARVPKPAAVTYVVRASGGARLKPTLTSVANEMTELDDVILLDDAAGMPDTGHSLLNNMANVRVLPADADWASAARGQLVCVVSEGDRLADGAAAGVQVAAAGDEETVAWLGESLFITPDGRIAGSCHLASVENMRNPAAPIRSAAVFWRADYLHRHRAQLKSPRWVSELLAPASERAKCLYRCLAFTDSERAVPAAPPAYAESPARGLTTRIKRKLKRMLKPLARRLPAPVKTLLRQLIK